MLFSRSMTIHMSMPWFLMAGGNASSSFFCTMTRFSSHCSRSEGTPYGFVRSRRGRRRRERSPRGRAGRSDRNAPGMRDQLAGSMRNNSFWVGISHFTPSSVIWAVSSKRAYQVLPSHSGTGMLTWNSMETHSFAWSGNRTRSP